MKIVTVLGSPRKAGNTAAVLKAFEELAATKHNVERINVVDHTINGCLGCDACYKKVDEPGCAQKDDGVAVLERMLAADVILYATPLYAWSFSAQMKALIDRHYCLVKWKDGEMANALLEGKHAGLLVTCGGGIEGNADLIPQIFARQMDYLRCHKIGAYIVPDCTTPKKLGDKATQVAQAILADITELK